MSEELKPCPLCGAQPELEDLAGWEISCNCGLNLCLPTPGQGPLIAGWNRRAAPPVAEAIPARGTGASIDTPEFWDMVANCGGTKDLGMHAKPLMNHINAYGQQQREEGRREVAELNSTMTDTENEDYELLAKENIELRERAEKAEVALAEHAEIERLYMELDKLLAKRRGMK